jgi:hypothetical protein
LSGLSYLFLSVIVTGALFAATLRRQITR